MISTWCSRGAGRRGAGVFDLRYSIERISAIANLDEVDPAQWSGE
jgi:hypothetical protein